jgi:hypothetical protein
MFERKSVIALAALASVATAALSPTGASAFGSHGGGGHNGGFGHGGFGYGGWNHSRYWNSNSCYWSYGHCWPYAYYHSSYSVPSYSAPTYSAPTPPIAVNQKVYVEGSNNGGLPPVAPEGPPPPR